MAFSDGPINAIDRRKATTRFLLENWAGSLEGQTKTGAPWRDQTSHARQGLRGGVEQDGDTLILFLAHSVEYGIWLEIACKKKEKRGTDDPGPYAIIIPTLEKNLPQIKQSILDLWS